jgi:ribosome maturation factor RimP
MAKAASVSDERFVRESGPAGEIAALAEPVIEDLGFRLVRVLVSGRDGGTVQVMAERADGSCTIEDCTAISRAISPLLDAHDPMPGRYHLEVSSPGIDRPLVRASDFEAWAGYEAKIELREAVSGRKRFRGTLEGFEDGEVRLLADLDDGDGPQHFGFPVALVSSAKLVMSDELVRAALAGGKAAVQGAGNGATKDK